jgi:hypothetical protein
MQQEVKNRVVRLQYNLFKDWCCIRCEKYRIFAVENPQRCLYSTLRTLGSADFTLPMILLRVLRIEISSITVRLCLFQIKYSFTVRGQQEFNTGIQSLADPGALGFVFVTLFRQSIVLAQVLWKTGEWRKKWWNCCGWMCENLYWLLKRVITFQGGENCTSQTQILHPSLSTVADAGPIGPNNCLSSSRRCCSNTLYTVIVGLSCEFVTVMDKNIMKYKIPPPYTKLNL